MICDHSNLGSHQWISSLRLPSLGCVNSLTTSWTSRSLNAQLNPPFVPNFCYLPARRNAPSPLSIVVGFDAEPTLPFIFAVLNKMCVFRPLLNSPKKTTNSTQKRWNPTQYPPEKAHSVPHRYH
ncbi:hypothetical protein TcG_08566 [Trypanosoma cruzi]|nr:hypothetical protein TcG_08566 [Trypanosoma cruzi]